MLELQAAKIYFIVIAVSITLWFNNLNDHLRSSVAGNTCPNLYTGCNEIVHSLAEIALDN